MELLFLDIDGVLNEIGVIGNRVVNGLEDAVDDEKVNLLEKEVYNRRDNLYTVISSSWRMEYGVSDFKEVLPGLRVIDKIGDNLERQEEIKRYVKNQDYLDAWVVVDDDRFRFDDINPHCVFTKRYKGITKFNCEDIRWYLAHSVGEDPLEEREFS